MTTKQQCLNEANKLEQHAKDSLQTWVIIGQQDKYSQYMEKAANLRKAAEMGVAERNYYIKERGLM